MKQITNVLGIGGARPLKTPLLDSVQWLDAPVLEASYENVKLRFEHNGGYADTQGDQNPYKFENEDKDLSQSTQQLSTTILVPMSVYHRRKELMDTQLMNLANSFLEAHLIYGGLGTKLFKDSPIKGALYYAHEAGTYKNVEELVKIAMTELENTGERILTFDSASALGTNLKTLTDDMLINPYGKLIKDAVESDGELPKEFVINTGSMALIGEREPIISTKDLLDKNTTEIAIAWNVAGVPTGLDVALKGNK